MKKLIATILLCSMFISGCAEVTPLQAYYNTQRTYVTALETFADLRDAGVIPESVNERLEPLRKDANAALVAWKAAITANKPAAASAAEKDFIAVNAAITALVNVYKKQ